MGNKFANGRNAIGVCDICGFQYKLHLLRKEVVRGVQQEIKACPVCWSPDHPQLWLGRYPVEDSQGLRQPRPDTTYLVSGKTVTGSDGGGSRVTNWGWRPLLGVEIRAEAGKITPVVT